MILWLPLQFHKLIRKFNNLEKKLILKIYLLSKTSQYKKNQRKKWLIQNIASNRIWIKLYLSWRFSLSSLSYIDSKSNFCALSEKFERFEYFSFSNTSIYQTSSTIRNNRGTKSSLNKGLTQKLNNETPYKCRFHISRKYFF